MNVRQDIFPQSKWKTRKLYYSRIIPLSPGPGADVRGKKNFGHMWSISVGQLYPGLEGLKKEGLINMLEAPSENGGPRKKLYSITKKGRKELMRWLASPPGKPMLIRASFQLFPVALKEMGLDHLIV